MRETVSGCPEFPSPGDSQPEGGSLRKRYSHPWRIWVFDYDCSARVPALRKEQEAGPNLWLEKAEKRLIQDRSLILFPTTHTVRNSLFGTRRLTTPLNTSDQYQLVYLHDYDLLRWPVFLGLSLQLMASCTFLGVDELARRS